MKEYFIYSNSFAAPFFSNSGESFVKANTPEEALEKYVKKYNHPYGLYSAAVYNDANEFHKGRTPLARWICNHELAKIAATEKKGGYMYKGLAPGEFEIDGKYYSIPDPKGGRIVK